MFFCTCAYCKLFRPTDHPFLESRKDNRQVGKNGVHICAVTETATVILSSLSITVLFVEIVMHLTLPVCLMADPI